MRPGQAAPVFILIAAASHARRNASMRPGQAAPVFQFDFYSIIHLGSRFNEAGAGCPGIPLSAKPSNRRSSASFNEAGAGCPGILINFANFRLHIRAASMRPGQAAPVFKHSESLIAYWKKLQ